MNREYLGWIKIRKYLLYLQYNTCSFNQIYRYIEPEIIVSVSIYRFTKIEKTKLCVRNPIEMTERDGGSRGKKMSRPFIHKGVCDHQNANVFFFK